MGYGNIKHILDYVSLMAVVGVLTSILPPLAAFFTIIWTVLRIIEMVTGKTIAQHRGKK